ncbi:HIT domain-containing protein [Asticcacaulis machinosus]|uniref:HIT domain-containing protein n=1 Tax=Asticcacaulis machinosus TaxID=2984211 RepID=A0ABT5HL87_9CAUL|nr:HIT domain-containing protein [Asticcacaulis machinosus]MDC7676900.1 HIT domain-containing protein [Asticcacaulis machinosus]
MTAPETANVPCLDCDYRLDDGFALDDRIEASSYFIAHLGLCQVRLQNDARFPWLVLVPTIADFRELTELSDAQTMDVMNDIRVAETLVRVAADHLGFEVEKLNIANLGNIVAQLHIHVIGRNSSDPAWPGPVWGFGQNEAYANTTDLISVLRKAL